MGIPVNSDMNDIMAQQRQWDDYQVVASENEVHGLFVDILSVSILYRFQ